MATSLVEIEAQARPRPATLVFGATAAFIAVSACLLAGWTPVAFSIATVFLFAGPHNWLEARYLMTRMPARWGRLRNYFVLAMTGVPVLAAAWAAIPYVASLAGADGSLIVFYAGWNTALVLWVAVLAELRHREKEQRDWPWIWPAAFLVIAATWLWPMAWSLALVYLHPLLALLFLDRELGRRQPALRNVYRGCLLLVPLLVGVLIWRLAAAPNLPGDDGLTSQITYHAGASVVRGVSTHLLVSLHTFLEMLHYGVWCLAIPLVTFGSVPWKLQRVPLARRSSFWRTVLAVTLLTGLVVMLVLWLAFTADYAVARKVYFTVAILHVLAEFPFLLRLL